jgi:hypothetical protein
MLRAILENPFLESKLDDLLQSIWDRSDGTFAFRANNSPDRVWKERPTFIAMSEAGDHYFSVLTFTAQRRSNENAAPNCGLLWADLDDQTTEHKEWMHRYAPPNILWETSPGMHQAIWFLDALYPTTEVVEWNRALTRAVGADSGGWFASKLLRVPATLNWKRAHENTDRLYVPKGRIIHADHSEWLYSDVKQTLRPFFEDPRPVGTPTSCPPVPTKEEWRAALTRLDPNSRDLSALNAPANGDRSAQLWKGARWLHKRGLTAEEIYVLLWFTRYNKWQDRPQKLWKDVLKAIAAG